MKYLIFIGCLVLGFFLIRYSKWLIDNVGRIDFFESHLGSAGTYTFYKLLGLVFIVFGFWYLLSNY